MIVDEDRPGIICFQHQEVTIQGSTQSDKLPITVCRKLGKSGPVTVSYETEADSAIEGADFEPIKGQLSFRDQEIKKVFYVKVNPKGKYEASEGFRVNLTDVTGGATF